MGHPAAQGLRGHVDQFDLVGPADHLVGDGLALRDAGDLPDDVVQRLQVLDVDGGDDVDPGGQQLVHVLPAPGVAPAGDVGVGELVHQRHGGPAGEDRVGVHLGERGVPVGAGEPGDDVEALEHVLGVPAAVALDEAHHHVRPAFLPAAGLVEHPVRLADAGGRTEVHPQPATAGEGAGGEVAGHGRCSFLRGRRGCEGDAGDRPGYGACAPPYPGRSAYSAS